MTSISYRATTGSWTLALAVAAALAASTGAQAASVERHRMNLGGPSGQYTDWQRSGIEGFTGLRTTIEIQKTHGRARDEWAAMARLNLFGVAEGGGDPPMLSLLLRADRRSGAIEALLVSPGEDAQRGIEFQGEVGRLIQVEMQLRADGLLDLTLDGAAHAVALPSGFRVDAVTAVGSGVDVAFDPFELLRAD
jgi:hypothetical protein